MGHNAINLNTGKGDGKQSMEHRNSFSPSVWYKHVPVHRTRSRLWARNREGKLRVWNLFQVKKSCLPFSKQRSAVTVSWEPGSQICQRDMTQSRARSCVTWGPNMPFSILIPLCKTAVNNSVLARQGMWAAEVNEWVIAGFTLIDLCNTVVLVKGLWTWVCSFSCL